VRVRVRGTQADKKGSCCIGRTCLCYRQHAECGKDCPCKCSALGTHAHPRDHPRSSNTLCARACVRAVRACVRAVRMRVRLCVRVRVCACVIVLISAAFSVCGNQHLRRAEGASVVHTSIVRDMSKRHNRFLINEPVKSGQLVRTVSSIMFERTQLNSVCAPRSSR
jgi:hypothetical protein